MLTINLSWSLMPHWIHSLLEACPKWHSVITFAFHSLIYQSFASARHGWPSPTLISNYHQPATILSFCDSVSFTTLPFSNFFSHWFIKAEHNFFNFLCHYGILVGMERLSLKKIILLRDSFPAKRNRKKKEKRLTDNKPVTYKQNA